MKADLIIAETPDNLTRIIKVRGQDCYLLYRFDGEIWQWTNWKYSEKELDGCFSDWRDFIVADDEAA